MTIFPIRTLVWLLRRVLQSIQSCRDPSIEVINLTAHVSACRTQFSCSKWAIHRSWLMRCAAALYGTQLFRQLPEITWPKPYPDESGACLMSNCNRRGLLQNWKAEATLNNVNSILSEYHPVCWILTFSCVANLLSADWYLIFSSSFVCIASNYIFLYHYTKQLAQFRRAVWCWVLTDKCWAV